MRLIDQLRDEIRAHREPAVVEAGKEVPGSIPFLRNLLGDVVDPVERDDMLGEMSSEYLRANLNEEHLLIERERVQNNPDVAFKWIGLALALSRQADGTAEAKESAAKAVELSRSAGTFIRYALTWQAIVAKNVGDSTLFQECLTQLIADAPNYRELDCGFGGNLLSGLPTGFCPAELAQKYQRIVEQYSA